MNNTFHFNKLKKKINNKSIVVGVIGQGYVGLSISILFSQKKFKVFGFDNNKNLIKNLQKGNKDINSISKIEIKKFNKKNIFTYDKKKFNECDVFKICLPTPLKNNKPDLSIIEFFIKI